MVLYMIVWLNGIFYLLNMSGVLVGCVLVCVCVLGGRASVGEHAFYVLQTILIVSRNSI